MAVLGLLSEEFPRFSLEENLKAVSAVGIGHVQFDMLCAVGKTLPGDVSAGTVNAILGALKANGISIAALSGTYNMIDPDPVRREAGAGGLDRLIELAPRLGTRIVTLCTGSRDPDDMWQRHADNDREDAWADLLPQVARAVAAAEKHGIVLGVEPEVSNTVNTPAKARRLLDEIGSPNLKIVMDGANIFRRGDFARMRPHLEETFELLGADITLAHAKDVDREDEAGNLPAGKGRLDFPFYLELLRRSGYEGAIILHALTPAETTDALSFVRRCAPGNYIEAWGP